MMSDDDENFVFFVLLLVCGDVCINMCAFVVLFGGFVISCCNCNVAHESAARATPSNPQPPVTAVPAGLRVDVPGPLCPA